MLLLRPFGFDTLPVWVYNLASESRYEQAALPALSIIVVALVPVAFLASSRPDSTARRPNVSGSRSWPRIGRAAVDHVTKRFGDVVAVDDVSFELGRPRGARPRRPQRMREVDPAAR